MDITTLTLNPALDKSAKVDQFVPEQKLKCHSIHYQAGGGGVNISIVLNTLQVKNRCIFTSGGDTGLYLKNLLVKENIDIKTIAINSWTRENLSIVDTKTELQYRFGMPGNDLNTSEIELIKTELTKEVKDNSILVLSGSLSEKTPSNLYVTLLKTLAGKNVKIIIDTSGQALIETLKENVYLVKHNQRVLAQLAGKEFLSKNEQEDFAMELIIQKKQNL